MNAMERARNQPEYKAAREEYVRDTAPDESADDAYQRRMLAIFKMHELECKAEFALPDDEREALKVTIQLRIDVLKDIEARSTIGTDVKARRQIDALVRFATRMEL